MKNPFLRPDSAGGSFLPQDYVARKSELRANLLCLGLFGVVMFGVVAAFFVTNRQWLQVRRTQNAITVQYSQEASKIELLKRLESQKADMMEKAEITTALIEKVPRSILMAELITRMPEDITLLELELSSKRVKDAAPKNDKAASGPAVRNLSGKGPQVSASKSATAKSSSPAEPEKVPPPKFEYTLKLTGVARVNNNVPDYLQGLKACTLLENVDLRYIKETTIDKLELRKFEIEAAIRKDADGRGIEPVKDLRASPGVPGTDPTKIVNPGEQPAPAVTGVGEKGGE